MDVTHKCPGKHPNQNRRKSNEFYVKKRRKLKLKLVVVPESRHPAVARDPVFANAKTCVADTMFFIVAL